MGQDIALGVNVPSIKLKPFVEYKWDINGSMLALVGDSLDFWEKVPKSTATGSLWCLFILETNHPGWMPPLLLGEEQLVLKCHTDTFSTNTRWKHEKQYFFSF